MINQLLQVSERTEQDQPYFKRVELKVQAQLLYRVNEHADQPIFKKQNFKYDKYELPKVISFDQFQLLIRPFKNHPSFKRNLKWNKITNAILPTILLLVVVPQFILIRRDTDPIIIMIWGIWGIVSFTLFFLILFLSQRVRRQTLDELESYCTTVSSQQNDVEIQFTRKNLHKGWDKCLFVDVSIFQVRSKNVEEDNTMVKLYTEIGFNLLSSSLDKPIFTDTSLRYDKSVLDKIISFQELQRQLRPFKSDEAYKKTVFWGRFLIFFMPSIFLILIPTLFHEKGKNQTLLIVCLVSMFVVFFGVFFTVICRLEKLRKKLVQNFTKFCQQLSRKHEKIEVIVHLLQKKEGLADHIYCLEVKCKNGHF